MKRLEIPPLLLVLLACSACSLTEPVVVIQQDGRTLRGTVTASMAGGSFTATDGTLTCGGNYDSQDESPTISMPVLCSDGRKGIVIATRSGNSGSGTVRMTDSSTATFMFGPAAASF